MRRLLNQTLIQWKNNPDRKPLILQGARQVGKTYLVQDFAKAAFDDCAYFNFEDKPELADIFQSSLEPKSLLENLSLIHGKRISPDKTLIFFDEVQLASRALTSLKYFCEQARDYHVIAAGSLLGVSIGQTSSFPVGKVNFEHLYPLNFIEFLYAIGENLNAEMLQNKKDCKPLAEPVHNKLLRLFNTFLFLGGMPEVIYKYVETRDPFAAIKIQDDILQSYINDFSKYAEPNESIKISNLWQSIPSQLARENKKFKFSDVESGARTSKYELALEWLRKAGLIYLAYNVSTPKLPLEGYVDRNKLKLYLLDSGLLTSRLKAPPELITKAESLYTEYKGALIENFVAKEIKPLTEDYLYYWTSKSAAEVDFIYQHKNKTYPFEVKSGLTKHKRSLQSYNEKYAPPLMIRLSPRNFHQENTFVNLPLYAACLVDGFLEV